MKTVTTTKELPTEARENQYFTKFKRSKRVIWSEHRHYSH